MNYTWLYIYIAKVCKSTVSQATNKDSRETRPKKTAGHFDTQPIDTHPRDWSLVQMSERSWLSATWQQKKLHRDEITEMERIKGWAFFLVFRNLRKSRSLQIRNFERIVQTGFWKNTSMMLDVGWHGGAEKKWITIGISHLYIWSDRVIQPFATLLPLPTIGMFILHLRRTNQEKSWKKWCRIFFTLKSSKIDLLC